VYRLLIELALSHAVASIHCRDGVFFSSIRRQFLSNITPSAVLTSPAPAASRSSDYSSDAISYTSGPCRPEQQATNPDSGNCDQGGYWRSSGHSWLAMSPFHNGNRFSFTSRASRIILTSM
jgi:hypothetical protein